MAEIELRLCSQAGTCASGLPAPEKASESDQECAGEQKWDYSVKPVGGRLIVRFWDYKLAPEHHAALTSSLRAADYWRVIERDNAASRFPTDFALVEVETEKAELMKVPSLATP